MKTRLIVALLLITAASSICFGQDTNKVPDDYKLLATTKTSTMQKELSEAAAQGYRVLVGAPTSDVEMALFLAKDGTVEQPYQYKLLATTRTGTMQKELSQAADEGYRLIPSTMIAKTRIFGGPEIVLIMERSPGVQVLYEYKLLATTRTSTLQNEVREAKEAGYVIVGMVSRDEHMVVMERVVKQ